MSANSGETHLADELNEVWRQDSHLSQEANDEIDIWSGEITPDPASVSDLIEVLSDDERARANRYVFPKDREHFIVCRGKLRTILGKYVDRAPKEIRFSYNRFGKPFLATEESGLRFNVSHSRGIAVIAISIGCEVGVDIEFVDQRFDICEVASGAFSAADVARMGSLSQQEQADAFYAAWTRKEALLKAIGDGLSTEDEILETMSFVADASRPLRSQEDGNITNWYVRSLELHSDFKAALAVEGNIGTIRFWDLHKGRGRAMQTKTIGVEAHSVCAE